ncbi:MAG: hypothetical protein IJ234_07140 [Clostridia bacterium]|nr:hypothetical protein [Clostridia bacterium]
MSTKKRNRTKYLYHGALLSIPQIAKLCGKPTSTIRHRIKELGMDAEEAADSEKPPNHITLYEWDGEERTIGQIEKMIGCGTHKLRRRIARGKTLEEAVKEVGGSMIKGQTPQTDCTPLPEAARQWIREIFNTRKEADEFFPVGQNRWEYHTANDEFYHLELHGDNMRIEYGLGERILGTRSVRILAQNKRGRYTLIAERNGGIPYHH